MIESLLPAYVSCAATREESVPDGTLFPEEEALVARSVPKRRNDFATARACARRAMGRLGLEPVAVLHGKRGMPLWPEGIVGSLTHCDGYRAAALARAGDVLSLGVDAEPHAPLPEGVGELVVRPSERERFPGPRAGEAGGIHWDRLLFSAKESVFKTWYPLTLTELDFDEADLTFHRDDHRAAGGTFTARLLRTDPALPPVLDGKWRVEDGIVATAVLLRPDRRAEGFSQSS
ncbi:phosphopantetheinyl transferase [Streptomyces sp. CB00316]|uniref:4'-phosphopantetheinyl transferase family protein n=1 Tax=unclassified Streptomyces TaxID=2593676 RepID=UPI00093C6900|nr:MULTISPECIES: 4'-phosphopantetheinyl transferase superfamily protein [unclassified Streptomyces]MBT2381375.1 4'-phosphopantetheinyl transferase superfamily protein [Streptomyces sp. ISL-111]MBT2430203.1 4'-phosphopantetheinyl transferase superfamily protein [Streptomyces sp. ISL-112]MBT2462839.1 4'-phosphopantetheinyl transferase superfamily protein [Streptomyces sp. ISL-63]OKJ21747.1 phosphopantetheinyl transferase [Streptomyces sp. CB00316]